MVVAQVDGERAVHLLVDDQHQHACHHERHEGKIPQDHAVANHGLPERLALLMGMRLGFRLRDGAEDDGGARA